MSLRKLKSMLIVAAIAVAAVSCKKKDEDLNINYVDGKLGFELPEFIHPGQVLTMTPRGLEHPDGGEIGYYWKVTPTMPNTFDTTRFLNGLDRNGKPSDGSYTFKFSDTLQTYTVYCNGFSEGYSTSSVNYKTTAVKPGPEQSIKGIGIDLDNDPYVKIGGIEYYYTTIGGLDWMRQDLSYSAVGTPFRKSKAMDGVFGLYFSYEEAIKACPEGWRLPTDAEWVYLATSFNGNTENNAIDCNVYIHNTIPGVAGKLAADAYFNDIKMWEYWPSMGKITNESKMGMIPTGYANLGPADKDGNHPSAEFYGTYEYAAYWTADKVEGEDGMAYYRYIYCKNPDLMTAKGDTKTFGAAVRCVRDLESSHN